jgi:hypothetical protein
MYLLIVATLLAFACTTTGASATQVLQLEADTTYQVSGPFSNAGGFLIGNLSFSGGSEGYSNPALNYPGDQAGYLVSITVGGIFLSDGGSTNPGPGYIHNNGSLWISESNPTFTVSDLSRYGWYYSSSTGYVQYDLNNIHGSLFLTLGDYGAPFVVTAVPEASTWAMFLVGFASIGLVAHRRRNRKAAVTT